MILKTKFLPVIKGKKSDPEIIRGMKGITHSPPIRAYRRIFLRFILESFMAKNNIKNITPDKIKSKNREFL